jgi:hypothetical protein
VLQGVAGRLGFRVAVHFQSIGLSGVIPAAFPVGAGGVVSASHWVGPGEVITASFWMTPGRVVPAFVSLALAGSYQWLHRLALGGPYRRHCRRECWFCPQIHPQPGPSTALLNSSHSFPVLFPWLVVLAMGASCSYWGLEADKVSHGWQLAPIVTSYSVYWRDCGHPCNGYTQVALPIPDTISDP